MTLTDARSTPRRPLSDPDVSHDWTPQINKSGVTVAYYCPDCLIAGAPVVAPCPDRVGWLQQRLTWAVIQAGTAEREMHATWTRTTEACAGTGLAPMNPGEIPNVVRVLVDRLRRAGDLVRHQRGPLHDAGLLTDEEYAALAADHGAVARLEGYDALRAERDEARGHVERLCAARERLAMLIPLGEAAGPVEGDVEDYVKRLVRERDGALRDCEGNYRLLVQAREERDTALARVRELEATLANERGEGAPPSEGWAFRIPDLSGWRTQDDSEHRRWCKADRIVYRTDRNTWSVARGAVRCDGPYPTARAAMVAADAALRGGGQ